MVDEQVSSQYVAKAKISLGAALTSKVPFISLKFIFYILTLTTMVHRDGETFCNPLKH